MSERRSRIFRVKSDSPSRIVVSDDIVRIIGDKNNFSFQPRVSARYLLNEDWSVKAS